MAGAGVVVEIVVDVEEVFNVVLVVELDDLEVGLAEAMLGDVVERFNAVKLVVVVDALVLAVEVELGFAVVVLAVVLEDFTVEELAEVAVVLDDFTVGLVERVLGETATAFSMIELVVVVKALGVILVDETVLELEVVVVFIVECDEIA